MVALYERQLKTATDEYLRQSLAGMPSESEFAARYTFSDRYERRIRRLIRRVRKLEARRRNVLQDVQTLPRGRSKPLTRKRLLIAAVILAVLLSVMGIVAAREAIVNFLVEVYEKYSTVIFPTEPGQSTAPTLPSTRDGIIQMLPTNLPAGYELSDLEISGDLVNATYKNEQGEKLILGLFAASDSQIQIDTEGILVEEVQIQKIKGLYYSNKGINNLVWQSAGYAFIISGKITKSELIFMAESTNR